MSKKIINKFSATILILCISALSLFFILSHCGTGPSPKTSYEKDAYAVRFDGVTGALGMQTVSGGFSFDYRNSPITVEAWIKPSSDKPVGCAVKTGDKDNGFFLYVSSTAPLSASSTARFGINTGGATCSTGQLCLDYTVDSLTFVNDNQWHHVAGVLANANHTSVHATTTTTCTTAARSQIPHIDIYVDGQFRNCTSAGYIGPCESGDMVGWDQSAIVESDTGFAFKGVIDEVRIWKEARTPAQILAGMNTEITADKWNQLNPNDTLKTYWKFNEGQETSINDSSGNNNNGIFESCTRDCTG